MVTLADSRLFKLIHDFLKVYLPIQRGCSSHTIRAYRTTLEQLLNFLKEFHSVPMAGLRFEMLSYEGISAFLEKLESEQKCSIQTRNLRLAAIRSFLNYAAMMDVTTVDSSLKAGKIPLKKSASVQFVEYMSEGALRTILSIPDLTTEMGMRNRFIMVLMYDTASRVQELLGLRLCDIRFGKAPTVTLHGKGNKVRTVPLMERTVLLLKDYLKRFHPNRELTSADYLFYVQRKGIRQQMSDDNIRKFLKEYAQKACALCPDMPTNVHPHMFRHSRAMHLYQHGMPLVLISQWLGHADLQTTLIYAHADTEQKRRAIESANGNSFISDSVPIVSGEECDEQTLKRLYGLA